MRNNCPICNTPGVGDWVLDFIVPDGWEMPISNTVLECPLCDMVWYDNDKTQADYDAYYINRYGFDSALNKHDNLARQAELAQISINLGLPHDARIVDFGGGHDKYIERCLVEAGYTDVRTCDAGVPLPDNIDLLISSQVFEHIYDLRGAMDMLTKCMSENGQFLIELPDAERMTLAQGQMLLDYHQKHCNHFPPYTLDYLFRLYGYYPRYQDRKLEGWHFGHIYRAVYGKRFDVYGESRELVELAVAERVAQLEKINQPVIVWACSDVALHLLARTNLDIVHYVDMDPHYRGETIGGLPVLDHVESDAPIVVMAYNQRSSILKNIEEMGIKNEVIIIK